MNFITKIILSIFFTMTLVGLQAQKIYEFTLKQAIDYAMQNNYDVIYSEMNINKAKEQMREATSIGLPQVAGQVDYTDNIQRPTTLLPGEFTNPPSPNPIPLQFGTKYSMNAGLFASQLVFSGQYIVGLQTAKIFLEKTNIDFFRDKVAVRQQVADSYYNVLSIEEGLWVVDTTLAVTKKLAEETRMTYEVGFAEEVDVDQLDLLVIDLESSKIYLDNQRVIAHAFLKFYLGIDSQDSLVLLDDMQSLITKWQESSLLAQPFDYRENVEYASIEKQREISFMQVKLERTNFMPTLMANINLMTNAQRDSWDFFDSNGSWFASSAFGVTLAIPIWSSGQRTAQVAQAKIAYEQMGVLENQMVTSLKLRYEAAVNEYFNAYNVYLNKDKSRKVAEKIFSRTSIKFAEGMASSLDILNTQTQFLSTEQEYINAGLALLKAGEELQKLLTKTITQ